jgi:hypothetical protein
MTLQPLTERARMAVALNAASYVKWVELRHGETPDTETMQQCIRGLLDEQGFSYEANEPQMIEVLALALDAALVESFIQKSGIFEDLDRGMEQLRQTEGGT